MPSHPGRVLAHAGVVDGDRSPLSRCRSPKERGESRRITRIRTGKRIKNRIGITSFRTKHWTGKKHFTGRYKEQVGTGYRNRDESSSGSNRPERNNDN